MNNIQCVTYENKNRIMVATSLKCGSTSMIMNLGYPLLGYFHRRKDRVQMFEWGYWKEYSFSDLNESILNEYPIRIAIVRNPIDRLFSAYKDRVVLRNKGGLKDHLETFSKFIHNIDYARKNPDIKIHTESQCNQIGYDPSIYTKVICSEDINDVLTPIISDTSGCPDIPAFLEKTTARKTKEKPVYDDKEKDINLIQKIYKDDYDVWGEYFC